MLPGVAIVTPGSKNLRRVPIGEYHRLEHVFAWSDVSWIGLDFTLETSIDVCLTASLLPSKNLLTCTQSSARDLLK